MRKKKGLLAAEKEFAEAKGKQLKNATWDEIEAFAEEKDRTDEVRNTLYLFALQKELTNGTTLDTDSDIDAIIKLVENLGGATNALRTYKSIKDGDYYVPSDAQKGIEKAAQDSIEDAFEKGKKKTKVGTSVKPSKSSKGSGSKSKKNKDKSKSTQQIDWISRVLDRLSTRLDLVKTKYDNLFNSKKAKDSDSLLKLQNKNLNDQYKILTKTEKYQDKAAKKYSKKAKNVKISKNKKENESLKKAVREGRIHGKDTKKLIATYGEKKAGKIQEYQDWYDKSQEQKKNKIMMKMGMPSSG